MARHLFGVTLPDWTLTLVDGVDSVNNVVQAVGGTTITCWNAETGGTQYTDLTDTSGTAIDHVTASDGNDDRTLGTIPPFYGPDDVWVLWLSADGGPRLMAVSPDVGSVLGPLVTALNLTLTAHQAAANPHGAATKDLTDVSTTVATDGQVPRYDAASGLYVPTTVEGLDPAGFVSTSGGSTVTIPEGDTTSRALQIRLPSGTRTSAANTMSVWWNSGSAGTPSWVEVFRVGPRGELVLVPSAVDRVPLEIRQFSGSQTADLTTWATSAGTPITYVDAAGRMRAPNLGITPSWSIDTATVVTGEYRTYNPTGVTLTLRGWLVSAGGSVPTGADLIINPKMDGVAIFASGSRPRIAAGGRSSGLVTTMSTAAWPALSYLTVDVDQVGSTQAGTKIHVQALAY